MSKIDQWENEVVKEINIFREEVGKRVQNVIRDVAKQGVEMLKTTGDYEDRTGKYRKSFRYKIQKTYKGTSARIYSTQPQLTHLLENGHVIINTIERLEKYGGLYKYRRRVTKSGLTKYMAKKGGVERTRAFPHWEPTEKFVAEELQKQMERSLSE
jgi:hypothetical protein